MIYNILSQIVQLASMSLASMSLASMSLKDILKMGLEIKKKLFNHTQYMAFIFCLLASVFFVNRVCATVLLGEHDWDPGPHNWTNEYQWTTLNPASTGGNTGGWLQVTFSETLVPEFAEDEWYDIVHTPATNLFAGSWTTNQWIQFDFWASNVIPGALQVQWKSSTNANIWGYTINPSSSIDTWSTFSASLLDWNDWQYPGSTEDQYLADLASIDWVGVYIYRNTASEQVYGIDNFGLWIPEPSEFILLIAVLIVFAMTYRKKCILGYIRAGPLI